MQLRVNCAGQDLVALGVRDFTVAGLVQDVLPVLGGHGKDQGVRAQVCLLGHPVGPRFAVCRVFERFDVNHVQGHGVFNAQLLDGGLHSGPVTAKHPGGVDNLCDLVQFHRVFSPGCTGGNHHQPGQASYGESTFEL